MEEIIKKLREAYELLMREQENVKIADARIADALDHVGSALRALGATDIDD
jgi:hypothetical protein